MKPKREPKVIWTSRNGQERVVAIPVTLSLAEGWRIVPETKFTDSMDNVGWARSHSSDDILKRAIAGLGGLEGPVQ